MRVSTVVLSVLLAASVAASGVVLTRQRNALVLAAGHAADQENAIAQQATTLKARDARVASLEQYIARLEAEKAARERALADLAELQKDRDAAKARAEQLAKLVDQFKKLVDAGKLEVVVRHGRLVLVLPNDVLFDEGKVALKSAGIAALAEIAETLKTLKDRTFQVVGHTDATPIKTAEFPSNWELSTVRALAVVKLLVDQGVPPSMLMASGRGEWEPLASNANAFARAKNRRIEIVLEQPIADIAKPLLKM